MSALLSTAYFPPVEYFAAMAASLAPSEDGAICSGVWLEACENYQKQSWRNRCLILSSNGPVDLRFPIVHRNGSHNGIPITEVEVDRSTPWLNHHKTAIDSAYRSSAFFDYYRDALYEVLDRRRTTLFEMNLDIIRFFLEKLGLPDNLRLTGDFGAVPEGCVDFREAIHPKRPNTILRDMGLSRPYFQVFSPKFGFVPGLSIMDLLFNEGPSAIEYIWKR